MITSWNGQAMSPKFPQYMVEWAVLVAVLLLLSSVQMFKSQLLLNGIGRYPITHCWTAYQPAICLQLRQTTQHEVCEHIQRLITNYSSYHQALARPVEPTAFARYAGGVQRLGCQQHPVHPGSVALLPPHHESRLCPL